MFAVVSAQAILLAVLVALYLISVIFLVRYLRRTRFYDCRLALTGRPGAGKTVLSVLLYEHLMNDRSKGIQFTADSQSAISTYQAIRGIAEESWPPRTTKGSVLQYEGAIDFKRERVVVDLEIGDSAGQHWLSLDESGGDPGYLQWVLSAQAIVHVLSVELLLQRESASERELTKEAEDLKLAARLMRSTKRDRDSAPLSPLLVVISKVDLVESVLNHASNMQDSLMKVYSAEAVSDSLVMSAINEQSQIDVTSLLALFAEELKPVYGSVHFMFSSILSVTSPMRLGISRADDALLWILDSARNSHRGRKRFAGVRR